MVHEAHRSFRATRQKRLKIDPNAVRANARVRKGVGDGSERSLERPGPSTWRPRRPTWRPRRPTWRPRWANLPSGGRPERVFARPQRDRERPRVPRDGQNQFFVDFRAFSVDFSSIFLTSRSSFGRMRLRIFPTFSCDLHTFQSHPST